MHDSPASWASSVDNIHLDSHPRLVAWLVAFLRHSRGREAVILRGSVSARDAYRDLLVAAVLRRWPLFRAPIIVTDATIEPGSRALVEKLPRSLRGVGRATTRWAARALVSAVDGPQVMWCVLSREELDTFPRTWGVDPARVVFTAWHHTLWGAATRTEVSRGGYVFAGGDSLRDYDLLADAVRGTGITVRVASTQWQPRRPTDEVEVSRVDHDTFVRWMANADAVVVPLVHSSRSAGQQTYLNAMALGKVVVVNDTTGVEDYIEHGVTGVITPSTTLGLRTALTDLYDPARTASWDEMAAAARQVALVEYSSRRYLEAVLQVASTAAGRNVAR